MLGADGRLRPLPRPQVRPDPARRLLPHALDVHHDRPQRDRPRPRPRADPHARSSSSTAGTRRSSRSSPQYEARELPDGSTGRLRAAETHAWPPLARWRKPCSELRSWTERRLLAALQGVALDRVIDPEWMKLSMAVRESREERAEARDDEGDGDAARASRRSGCTPRGPTSSRRPTSSSGATRTRRRGSATQGFLQVLDPAPDGPSTGRPPRRGRARRTAGTALADWLTDADHGAGPCWRG